LLQNKIQDNETNIQRKPKCKKQKKNEKTIKYNVNKNCTNAEKKIGPKQKASTNE